jgi:hypothetical protein
VKALNRRVPRSSPSAVAQKEHRSSLSRSAVSALNRRVPRSSPSAVAQKEHRSSLSRRAVESRNPGGRNGHDHNNQHCVAVESSVFQSLMGTGTRGCAGRHSSASLCSAKFNIRVDLPETRFELKRPVRYSNRPVNSHRNSKMTPAQVAEAQKLAGHERTGRAGVIVKTKRFACVPGLPFLKNRREQWNCCVSPGLAIRNADQVQLRTGSNIGKAIGWQIGHSKLKSPVAIRTCLVSACQSYCLARPRGFTSHQQHTAGVLRLANRNFRVCRAAPDGNKRRNDI